MVPRFFWKTQITAFITSQLFEVFVILPAVLWLIFSKKWSCWFSGSETYKTRELVVINKIKNPKPNTGSNFSLLTAISLVFPKMQLCGFIVVQMRRYHIPTHCWPPNPSQMYIEAPTNGTWLKSESTPPQMFPRLAFCRIGWTDTLRACLRFGTLGGVSLSRTLMTRVTSICISPFNTISTSR